MKAGMVCRCFTSLCLVCCISTSTLGQEAGSTDALFQQARKYQLGEGVPKDLATAIRLYKQAAQMGNTSSMVELGVLKAEAVGEPRDLPGAFELFTQAATAGDAIGQFLLATCYLNGIGTQKDLASARKWFLPAAAAGKQPAEFMLGIMLANGQGGPKKMFAARRWLDKASTGPDSDTAMKAANLRDKLDESLLSPDNSGVELLGVAAFLAAFVALASAGDHSQGTVSNNGSSNSLPSDTNNLTGAMQVQQMQEEEQEEEEQNRQRWDDQLRGMRCGINPPPGCF